MRQVGFPCSTPNSKCIGYFIDETFEFTNVKGEKVSRTFVMLKHWVPGVSGDYSSSTVKNDAEGERLKREFPQAWEHYQREKAKEAPAAPPIPTATEYGIKGTPIEELTFIGKDHLARLKQLGFYTAEQLRDMSDTACNNVGFGAKDWRRKASEHLFVVKDREASAAASQGAANAGLLADLMRQLAEANEAIAELKAAAQRPATPSLVEAVTEPHDVPEVGAPTQRRRKATT